LTLTNNSPSFKKRTQQVLKFNFF